MDIVIFSVYTYSPTVTLPHGELTAIFHRLLKYGNIFISRESTSSFCYNGTFGDKWKSELSCLEGLYLFDRGSNILLVESLITRAMKFETKCKI